MVKRLEWQAAAVERIIDETPRVKTFAMRMPRWRPFRAGQHFDVRLTAPDGYRAERSYSIASAPEQEDVIELTIALLDNGEVSPFFHEIVAVGDAIEMRGPIGGPFTWSTSDGGPLLLLGGGSGIVPLMSMLRHRERSGRKIPAALLYSSRTGAEIIFKEELEHMARTDPALSVHHTLTRDFPAGWTGFSGRIDAEMVAGVAGRLGDIGRACVCGPDGFVETAADLVVGLGVPPDRIRTERFGPTGS